MNIEVKQLDDVNLIVNCDKGIAREISDRFSFLVPGYQFMPKFKNGFWDGRIRLFNHDDRTLPVGLLSELKNFAKFEEYSIDTSMVYHSVNKVSPKQIKYFIDKLDIRSKGDLIEPHDYQMFAVYSAIRNKRRLLLSPTSSGKSLMIYVICRMLRHITKKKTLIIVPNVGLVHQLAGDFQDYSSHDANWDAEGSCHLIMSGKDKNADRDIYISTWQSIYKMPMKYWKQFGAVLCDETHLATANSISSIMNKLLDCPYRIGLTGTLEDAKASEMQLTGLFGDVTKVISTKELMDRGAVAQLHIKAIQLLYSEEYSRACRGLKYQDEVDWLITNPDRQEFIAKLAVSQKKNTMLLYDRHVQGDDLLQRIQDLVANSDEPDRPVYQIKGSVKGSERERIRQMMETHTDAILLGTYATISTGFSLKNLHSVLFCSSTKSKIRVLQSIGRGLRMNSTKLSVILYDIVDDMSYKKFKNYGIKHFIERCEHYDKERFDYEIKKVKLL